MMLLKSMYNTDVFQARQNATRPWANTDSFEVFSASTKNLYNIDDISYKFNNYGFRCDDFEAGVNYNPILFMGCSITEGIGLPVQHMWSHRVVQQIRANANMSCPFWSLATAGSSIAFQAELLTRFFTLLRPSALVIQLPSISRHNIRTNFNNYFVAATTVNNHTRIFLDPSYCLQQAQQALSTINLICSLANIPCFVFTHDATYKQLVADLPQIQLSPFSKNINVDVARDMQHPGPASNQAMADVVLNSVGGELVKIAQTKGS